MRRSNHFGQDAVHMPWSANGHRTDCAIQNFRVETGFFPDYSSHSLTWQIHDTDQRNRNSVLKTEKCWKPQVGLQFQAQSGFTLGSKPLQNRAILVVKSKNWTPRSLHLGPGPKHERKKSGIMISLSPEISAVLRQNISFLNLKGRSHKFKNKGSKTEFGKRR